MRFAARTDRLAGLGSDRWAVHHRALERKAAGERVILLSIGEPDTDTPAAIVDSAIASLRAGRTHYSRSQGEPALLEALARRYAARSGRAVTPGHVIFMPGAHTALYGVCQAVLDPGDQVLVADPTYAAYDAVLASTGAAIVRIPLDPDAGFQIDVGAFEAAAGPAARMIVLNSPHNPTGAVFEPSRIEALAELCRRRGMWLVSDEVYESLVFDGTFSSPFDGASDDDLVAVVSSVSKSHAMTGWRCGWAIGPPALIERVLDVSEAMMFGAQPFLQDATVTALEGEFEECAAMRADYRRRAGIVTKVLDGSPVVSAHQPQGGIFVMVDVRPTGATGIEFANGLLEREGVATMPGESFGEAAAGHLRISLTAADDEVREGTERLRRLAESW